MNQISLLFAAKYDPPSSTQVIEAKAANDQIVGQFSNAKVGSIGDANQQHGAEISPQGAQHYDATSGAGARAAKKWHGLFEVARQAFLDDVVTRVPEAHKAVRIQELARASRIFKKRANYLAMANMLEKIARETGDSFTNRNRHELTGRDRGPIEYQDVKTMTDEQISQELDEILAKSGHALVPIN